MIVFNGIEFWYWWILALLLVGLEVFVPGAIFLWMGVAAGVVGLLLLLAPDMAWQYQAVFFAVLSVGAIYGWRLYQQRHPPQPSDQPALNRRGSQYINRTFTLNEPMINGQGMLHIDDTRWKIEGEQDLPAGAKVRVTGVDGTVLTVERA